MIRRWIGQFFRHFSNKCWCLKCKMPFNVADSFHYMPTEWGASFFYFQHCWDHASNHERDLVHSLAYIRHHQDAGKGHAENLDHVYEQLVREEIR